LIKEEGQPIAVLFSVIIGALGTSCVTGFLLLVSQHGFKAGPIYVFVGILFGLFVIYAFIGMKDVIYSKDFDIRR
jgi:hypothetical protein